MLVPGSVLFVSPKLAPKPHNSLNLTWIISRGGRVGDDVHPTCDVSMPHAGVRCTFPQTIMEVDGMATWMIILPRKEGVYVKCMLKCMSQRPRVEVAVWVGSKAG